jgi:hypothetical protein
VDVALVAARRYRARNPFAFLENPRKALVQNQAAGISPRGNRRSAMSENNKDALNAIERMLQSQRYLCEQIETANPDDPYAALIIREDIEIVENSLKRLVEALQNLISEWEAFKYSGYVPPEDGDARYYAEEAVSDCANQLKELLSEALHHRSKLFSEDE